MKLSKLQAGAAALAILALACPPAPAASGSPEPRGATAVAQAFPAQTVALDPPPARAESDSSAHADEPAGHADDEHGHGWGTTYGISNELLMVGAASSVVGLGVALAAGEVAGGLAAGTIVTLFVLHLPVHMVIWGGGGMAAWEGTKWALGWQAPAAGESAVSAGKQTR